MTDPKGADLKLAQKLGPVMGTYHGTSPVLVISDPELVKQVLVKDFPVFVNRNPLLTDHPVFKHNLVNVESEQWRRIRTIVSPTFSSGKLKAMHALISRCTALLVDHLTSIVDGPAQGRVNFKNVVTGYAIDVIAATSFATDTNCNADGESVFKRNGLQLATGNIWRFLAQMVLPRAVNRWAGNSVAINPEAFNFFVNLSREIVRQRKAEVEGKTGKSKDKSKKRTDLVQLLMDAFAYESEGEQDFEKLTAMGDKGKPFIDSLYDYI